MGRVRYLSLSGSSTIRDALSGVEGSRCTLTAHTSDDRFDDTINKFLIMKTL